MRKPDGFCISLQTVAEMRLIFMPEEVQNLKKLKKYKPTKFKTSDSKYDEAAADYAVNFIECLCHTKGTWAGKPFELIDWQEQIIRASLER